MAGFFLEISCYVGLLNSLLLKNGRAVLVWAQSFTGYVQVWSLSSFKVNCEVLKLATHFKTC